MFFCSESYSLLIKLWILVEDKARQQDQIEESQFIALKALLTMETKNQGDQQLFLANLKAKIVIKSPLSYVVFMNIGELFYHYGAFEVKFDPKIKQ